MEKITNTASIIFKNACKPTRGIYGQWETAVKAYAHEINGVMFFPLNPGGEGTGWISMPDADSWCVDLGDKVVLSITFSRKVKAYTTNAFDVLVAQQGKDENDNERSIDNLASKNEVISEHRYAVSLQDNGEDGVRWVVHSEVDVELKDGHFKVTDIPYSDPISLNADQIAQIIGRVKTS